MIPPLQVFATMKGLLTRQPFAVGGSGSSYVYGFVDAEYRRGMNKQECQQFVVNSKIFSFVFFLQGFWWFDAQGKPDSWCFLYWQLTTPTLLCHVTASKYCNNLHCKNNIVLFISLSRSSFFGNEPWWLQRRRGLHRHHRWTRHRGKSDSRKSVTHLLWPITH